MLLQGIVCVVFLADFFARMWMADHSWRFFFRNLYFFLLSVPYLNIVDWMGIELSHAEAMLMGLGGEKMRRSFCCLMIADNTPDMFILDEPTNNLDIESIEIITATIRDYAGTVIAISHDREFLKDTGIEREILLE